MSKFDIGLSQFSSFHVPLTTVKSVWVQNAKLILSTRIDSSQNNLRNNFFLHSVASCPGL